MTEINPSLRNTSISPPPNCAICLSSCTNRCFSDSCMHQFCFKCLLEWSKVKAVCPLCKQPFTSIIHNVKSNSEYEEHFVEPPLAQDLTDGIDDDFLFLPGSVNPSRHFQFRTTFTVVPGGELAIQQLLLTHPLANNPVFTSDFSRHRRLDNVGYRRRIYQRDLWVTARPDVTGRYRDITPTFFRNNPAAKHRLRMWLNRELAALLHDTLTQSTLAHLIMETLSWHHIRSRFFKNLLQEYLGNRTEHFVHEFSSYMRSPFDMVGYDRITHYTSRSQLCMLPTVSEEDDSDEVTVVSTTNDTPISELLHQPTIEVIEINSDSSHDSDVILNEAAPVVVDLLNSESDDTVAVENANEEIAEQSSASDRKYKSKKIKKDRRRKSKGTRQGKHYTGKSSQRKYVSSDSSLSSEESSVGSNLSSSDDTRVILNRHRKLRKMMKRRRHTSSDSSDDEPLIRKLQTCSRHNDRALKCRRCRCKMNGRSQCDPVVPPRESPERESPVNYKRVYPSSTQTHPSFDPKYPNGTKRPKLEYDLDQLPIDYSMNRQNVKVEANIVSPSNSVNYYCAGTSNEYITQQIEQKPDKQWYLRPPLGGFSNSESSN